MLSRLYDVILSSSITGDETTALMLELGLGLGF